MSTGTRRALRVLVVSSVVTVLAALLVVLTGFGRVIGVTGVGAVLAGLIAFGVLGTVDLARTVRARHGAALAHARRDERR